MSEPPLGTPDALDAVRQLKRAAADAAQREEAIEKQFRLDTARSKREHSESSEVIASERETALADQEAWLEHATSAAAEKHTAREEWIARASANAGNLVTQTIEGQKGKQISQVQAQTLEAKRARDAELAEAKTSLAELEDQLHENRGHYHRLRAAARAAFRGFPGLVRGFSAPTPEVEHGADRPPDVMALGRDMREQLKEARDDIAEFQSLPLPKLFRYLPLQWLAPMVIAAIVAIGAAAGWAPGQFAIPGGIAAAVLAVLFVLQRVAAKSAVEPAASIAESLGDAAKTFKICRSQAKPWLERRREQLEAKLEDTVSGLNQGLTAAIREAEGLGAAAPDKLGAQEQRLRERIATRHKAVSESIRADHEASLARITADLDAKQGEADAAHAAELARFEEEHNSAWGQLESDWHETVDPIYRRLEHHRGTTAEWFPAWDPQWTGTWEAPREFAHRAPFGQLAVELGTLAGGLPSDPRLALPGEGEFDVPLCLDIPAAGSLLFESPAPAAGVVAETMNNLILRLLAVAPPGKLSFSIFDPVGLGQNFAGVTHLADHEDSLINKKIWTSREQIEERIAELGAHMEKVIQMYLRNEYQTITEYNKQAGNIAEKYHYLVVADFPANLSDAAARGLMSIAQSGARCGIYTLIHWDNRGTTPESFSAEDLRKSSTCLIGDAKGAFHFNPNLGEGATLHFDPPPGDDIATGFVRKIGDASDDTNRIEVPFAHIMPGDGEYWQSETTGELRVPIGRTGATKLQQLAIGKGTRQHALIAGKTGSGKSTLFHVMITNLALHHSPDEVEFYLVDFKKGVEFKCYGTKKLPHAKVVAIESDREFGLSVLQRLDVELKRRGELFRELGVQDLAGFRRESGEAMPRSLLMIDEFQEFFVEDDKIAQNASVLLDRIVRQGRAFGIHVILGSQTLGGAYSLARATLGQMVIRIALQCNEADAFLIMDEGNSAPRMLTRPGEGIYNDSAGALEGNSPFQTVWLPEDERDAQLDRIAELNAEAGRPPGAPIVFEGNAPADVEENVELAALLAADEAPSPAAPKIWLGAPNAIKGPTEASFHRQSGNHLLVVGQRDDAILAMLAIALKSLSAQYPADGARFVVIDSSPPGSTEREFLDAAADALAQEVETSSQSDPATLIGAIAEELKVRSDAEDHSAAPPLFVVINGLQKFKKLRYDDDLAYSFDASAAEGNPALQLDEIAREGAALGVHLIVAMDSYNNVSRTLSRKAIGEFEMRILFQMSANDSAALIDATKASALGMHRALFYNEHQGYLETFRPYAQPTGGWFG